ncbi:MULTISPECIES: thiosulfate oxidation carrier complex protein SoxZ [Halorhodospira]|uniref:thiosulfate oxidation carrier complex protein SoxZ n=1 Tax=Halorhodospira TaxID=85108 RepID=UPI001913B03E|nr:MULTISPECIES: thiosulfate oxidation carrier complex protein SoxZ [Halorhodospira]MBK5936537.1 thiosulfate oxidation carrier complex protein SoxZ [Halorhodospira halophila]MCG5539981.1 thiosulfate oxidation carrier complex protein SoxZ [Halorhodospira sp. M39old]MCG5545183.1 thiosulfate oxidation carrier complex protein SoxZ [Halorhodospira sp. M38]
MSSIRARATLVDGMAEVRALISHPMDAPDEETGDEGHFIQEVIAEINGEKVLHAHWGPSISPNPLIEFETEAEAGDTLKIRYTDNRGEGDSHEMELA